MAESNKNRVLFFFLLFLYFSPYSSLAQSNYIIYFSDKDNSSSSLNNPASFLSTRAIERRYQQNISVNLQDIPVNPAYLDSLTDIGSQVLVTSKWLNAALVFADPSQVAAMNNLSFVKKTEVALRKTQTQSTEALPSLQLSQSFIDYGSSLNQISMIGIDDMHQQGFHGEGRLIAVIDGGFQNLNSLPLFDSLFINNRILATYDFVDQESDVYDDHYHGMQVMSLLASYSEGVLIGGAWKSDYILLRSEDANSEYLGEELFWAAAAEYADSAGVDIINSSLGYNTFDNASANHSYSDLDGNTTIITQAADIAASKGILVVNSAGNEGNSSWKYVLAPADGDSVLAVGSVDPAGVHFFNSSKGPAYDGRIKPDVAAQGNSVVVASPAGGTQIGSGTSFAAPMITGLAAGLWQAFPSITNMELMYFLRRSASQYHHPDEKLGYGIPNFTTALKMIEAHREMVYLFPNPVEEQALILNLPDREVGNKIVIRFTDVMGRFITEEIIPQVEIRTELKTNMAFWSPGFYLLTLVTPSEKYVMKIVKK